MKGKQKAYRPSAIERKGWSVGKLEIMEGVSPKDIDRMSKTIMETLDNNHTPTAPQKALLKQVQLVCERIIAFQEWGSQSAQVNKINIELARHTKVLHRHGFGMKKDIIPLNLWITRRVVRQQYGVEKLLFRVKNKIASVSQKGEKETK